MKVETKQKTELKKRYKAECRGEENKRLSLLLIPLTPHYSPLEVQSSLQPTLGTNWQDMFLDKLLHRMREERAGGSCRSRVSVITVGRAHTRRAAL